MSHDPQVIRAYDSDPLVHDRVTGRLRLGMLARRTVGAGPCGRVPAAAVDLIHGGADRLTSPSASQEFAGKVATDCTLKQWDGLYHETHNEFQKAEVLAFMIGWLDGHCSVEPGRSTAGNRAN